MKQLGTEIKVGHIEVVQNNWNYPILLSKQIVFIKIKENSP